MSANFTPNQNEYKNLTPFKSWLLLQINTWGQVNFPFVESDFDELTNYGMMQKLMGAVNDVISNENLVEQDVTNLFGAFTELQSYVNDYFDNLDVQDEINAKLDAMAQDGSLTYLIKKYIDPLINAQQTEIITFKNEIDSNILELQNEISSVASGSPLVATSTSEMTDTSRVYVNTTDGKWYYYDGDSWEIGGTYQSSGIADNSVTPIKTNFMNLYDNITILDNKYAVGSTGAIADGGASWKCTDYLSIPSSLIGRKILVRTHIKLNAAIVLYDAFKNKISAITDSTDAVKEFEITIPNYTKYIVVSCLTSDINSLYIGLNDVKQLIEDFDSYYTWLNYLNMTIEGEYVNASTGVIASHVDLTRTPYIYIPENLKGTTLQINTFISGQAGICFYDVNKNFISGVSTLASNFYNYKVLVPNNAFYIIISCRNNSSSIEDNFFVLTDVIPSDETLNNQYKQANMFAVYRNVGVVGDSLSSGASAVHDDTPNPCPDNYEYSWTQFMGRMNHGNYINLSRGGLNTETWFTNSSGYEKAMLPENKCECYLLAIGTNDASGKGMNYLGTINDIDLNDYTHNANSFYGNYAKIIQVLRENSPKCHIFVITMPRSDSTRVAYNTAMKNIAELFNDCFVIDMEEYYNDYYINGFISENLRQGHFNAVGYNAMAILLDDLLDKYMYNNLQYFKYIDFINTQYENDIPIINE